jgi:hypothetical protein
MWAALACLVFMMAVYPNKPPTVETGPEGAETDSDEESKDKESDDSEPEN